MARTKKKPCPSDVKYAGAQLLKLHRMGEALAEQAIITIGAVKATIPGMVKAGAKEMEAGQALALLHEAARAEGLSRMAHESLRGVLGRLGFEEPTDQDIVEILEKQAKAVRPMGGGGGGGRGRGGR
jgi:hypothetical protein